jgi:hypothetical protein
MNDFLCSCDLRTVFSRGLSMAHPIKVYTRPYKGACANEVRNLPVVDRIGKTETVSVRFSFARLIRQYGWVPFDFAPTASRGRQGRLSASLGGCDFLIPLRYW